MMIVVECQWCKCEACIFWNSGEPPVLWFCEDCATKRGLKPIMRRI